MTIYQQVLNNIQVAGFGEFVVKSHEEAQQNNRKKNIVLTEEDNGYCDIYLTYKYQGTFDEFVCWVADEFEDEPDLVSIISNAVETIYSQSDEELDHLIETNQIPSAFNCRFTA